MKFDQVIFPLPLLPNSLQGVVSLTTQKNIKTQMNVVTEFMNYIQNNAGEIY